MLTGSVQVAQAGFNDFYQNTHQWFSRLYGNISPKINTNYVVAGGLGLGAAFVGFTWWYKKNIIKAVPAPKGMRYGNESEIIKFGCQPNDPMTLFNKVDNQSIIVLPLSLVYDAFKKNDLPTITTNDGRTIKIENPDWEPEKAKSARGRIGQQIYNFDTNPKFDYYKPEQITRLQGENIIGNDGVSHGVNSYRSIFPDIPTDKVFHIKHLNY